MSPTHQHPVGMEQHCQLRLGGNSRLAGILIYTYLHNQIAIQLAKHQIIPQPYNNQTLTHHVVKASSPNHSLILYRHLTCSPWPILQITSMRRKTLLCTEEEEALLYCIIISNLSFIHYPIQHLSFSFPNFMAAHGVGVAQAKLACKHTIARRKCYQYNTNLVASCSFVHFHDIDNICIA